MLHKFILFTLLAAPVGNHWISLKGSARVHKYYVDHYGNVIGHYYQMPKSTWQVPVIPTLFTAQCDEGRPVEFGSEQDARAYVLACPE